MAKNLDEKIVKHVARLANLNLTTKQVSDFKSQLSSVLNYVSQIQKLDTNKTPETHQVTGLKNIFRQDKIDKSRLLTQKEALANAKNTHNGYFMVDSLF